MSVELLFVYFYKTSEVVCNKNYVYILNHDITEDGMNTVHVYQSINYGKTFVSIYEKKYTQNSLLSIKLFSITCNDSFLYVGSSLYYSDTNTTQYIFESTPHQSINFHTFYETVYKKLLGLLFFKCNNQYIYASLDNLTIFKVSNVNDPPYEITEGYYFQNGVSIGGEGSLTALTTNDKNDLYIGFSSRKYNILAPVVLDLENGKATVGEPIFTKNNIDSEQSTYFSQIVLNEDASHIYFFEQLVSTYTSVFVPKTQFYSYNNGILSSPKKNNNFFNIACDSSGKYVYAVSLLSDNTIFDLNTFTFKGEGNYIYKSDNYGVDFHVTYNNKQIWNGIATDKTGKNVYACSLNTDYLSNFFSSIGGKEIIVNIQTDTTNHDSHFSGTNFHFYYSHDYGITWGISPNICFGKGTQIDTDQGPVCVENINIRFHTIDGKRIISLLKMRNKNKILVKISKNAFASDFPKEDVFLTHEHNIQVWFPDYWIPCRRLINQRTILSVPYEDDYVYNLLLEKHTVLTTQGLKVESLHPKNSLAVKIFQSIQKKIPTLALAKRKRKKIYENLPS